MVIEESSFVVREDAYNADWIKYVGSHWDLPKTLSGILRFVDNYDDPEGKLRKLLPRMPEDLKADVEEFLDITANGEQKDLYNGMPGLRPRSQHEPMVQRAKRHKSKRRAVELVQSKPITVRVKEMLYNDIEEKVRHVRDVDFWHLPYGTPLGQGEKPGDRAQGIVRDAAGNITHRGAPKPATGDVDAPRSSLANHPVLGPHVTPTPAKDLKTGDIVVKDGHAYVIGKADHGEDHVKLQLHGAKTGSKVINTVSNNKDVWEKIASAVSLVLTLLALVVGGRVSLDAPDDMDDSWNYKSFKGASAQFVPGEHGDPLSGHFVIARNDGKNASVTMPEVMSMIDNAQNLEALQKVTTGAVKDMFDDLEYKAVDRAPMHVRTLAGEKKFKQPISSIIIAGVKLPNLRDFETDYEGHDAVQNIKTGKAYVIYKHADDDWSALDHDEPNWDEAIDADSAENLYIKLDGSPQLAKKIDAAAKARGGTSAKKPPPPPKKATAKTTTAKRGTAKVRAASTAKKATAKKEPELKDWQIPWDQLSEETRQQRLSIRGKIPAINKRTKKPFTKAEIARKRKGRTIAKQIANAERNGWVLITDDNERHQLGIDIGKPIPPNWSHVMTYEGPDKDQRKTTIQGLDWMFGWQALQTKEQRGGSLENKFGRQERLAPKLPKLARQTEADVKKGNETAALVRMLWLTGGRVDSEGDTRTGNRGISTLQPRDVKIDGNTVSLDFIGKSYQRNTYEFDDKTMADWLRKNMKGKKPTDPLFPSTNSDKSGDYLKSVVGNEFRNHDLRTAYANAIAIQALADWQNSNTEALDLDNEKQIKKWILAITTVVGEAVNDKPGTVYNSYINPKIFVQMGIPLEYQPPRGDR